MHKMHIDSMLGVILAGGEGTRLRPLTNVTNKHLLPIYNKPMIYYPLEFMRGIGVKDIVIVAGREFAGDFADLFGDGSSLGVNFTYKVQEGSPGIAHALGLVKHIARGDPVAVILGDNIFVVSEQEMAKIKESIDRFAHDPAGALLFLKDVPDPERFGVAYLDESGKVTEIVEKPKEPKSRYAVTGLYVYDNTVFAKIGTLKPSKRNELEITDVNNMYLREGRLSYHIVKGSWTDAGTFESLFRANTIARDMELKRAVQSKKG